MKRTTLPIHEAAVILLALGLLLGVGVRFGALVRPAAGLFGF